MLLLVAMVRFSSMTATEGFSLSMMSSPAPLSPSQTEKGVAIIAGATGYIGRSVVQESVRQGYHTVALVRDVQKVQSSGAFSKFFEGADLIECDVSDPNQLLEVRKGREQSTLFYYVESGERRPSDL